MKIKGFKIDQLVVERQELSIVKATQISLNRPVFLKILKDLESDKVILERFEQEAKLLARLNHPNIVTIYEFCLTERHPYLALEYFEGVDLAVHLKQHQPLSAKSLISIYKQVLTGCSKAHLAGVLHSDIKPENLLINQDGLVKISDFGLASLLGSNDGQLVGTPGYMAPELALGESISVLTDIYAVGMTFYTLAGGENPLKGDNLSDSLNRAIQMDPPDLRITRPDLSEDLIQLIERMIAKTPHERLKSCDRALELLGEIEPGGEDSDLSKVGLVSHQEKAPTIQHLANKRVWFLFAVIVTLAIMLGYLLLWEDPESTAVSSDEIRSQFPESGTNASTSEQSQTTLITLEPEQEPKPEPDAGELSIALDEAAAVDSISLSTEGDAPKTAPNLNPGLLYVIVNPWATIWIDSLKIGVTPLPEPISITAGQHTVQFMHPNYPDITKQIWVAADQADTLSMNWSSELGFLQLTVHPWAEVYVDSKSYDTTPIHQAIPLQPGEFQLLLTNPNYPPWNQYLHVGAGDTLRVNVRLRKSEGL